MDSLCPKRSSGSSDGSTRVVNQLLTELDGVEGRAGVWVLAATNRPDILDPAVMRPGRLDKTLFVGFPAPSERVEILGAITKGGSKPRLGAGLSLHALGMDARCDGFSGADMGNLVREASMAALREAIRGGATSKSEALVEERHFEKAFASVKPSVGEKERARYEVLKAKYGHGVEEDETATIRKTMSVDSSPATGHQNVTSNSISLSPGLSNDAATTPKAALSFTPSSSSNNSSMFGGSSKPVGGSVFGGAAASSSLFGSSASSPFKPAGNLFSTPASNVFSPSSKSSAEASSSSSIFSTVKTEASSSSIFSTPAKVETANIFSRPADSTSSTGLFGKPITQDSSKVKNHSCNSKNLNSFQSQGIVFGASPITSPAASSGENTAPESAISSNAPVFGSSATTGTFNFTALASATGEGLKTATEGFKFSGAGSSLFSSPGKQQEEDEDGEEGEGGHDPYFEPIVPLPELVEVKTGEEDEEVLFKHRAKVYRYCGETKQWKERGVGDIKILKHKVSSVHRVLLRRDQVHKIAANHRITPEMELKPLASSETAWCWYAMDFSEGHEAEGSLEHLAVRFKTADAAQEFKSVFNACQEGKTKTAVPDSAVNAATVDERAEVQPDPRDEEDEEEEEYGEDDEDYEAGETIMFHQVSHYLKSS